MKNCRSNCGKLSRGRSIRLNLFPPPVVQPGDEMADADLLDHCWAGYSRLADYKGKYLLLDFWSIGCGPCRMAMPEMRRMGEVYRDGADGDQHYPGQGNQLEKVFRRAGDRGGEPAGSGEPDRTVGLLRCQGIPHYVLISPEGKVITSWAGYAAGSSKRSSMNCCPIRWAGPT